MTSDSPDQELKDNSTRRLECPLPEKCRGNVGIASSGGQVSALVTRSLLDRTLIAIHTIMDSLIPV